MNTSVSTNELRMSLFDLEDKLRTCISSTENCMKVAIRFKVASNNGRLDFPTPVTNVKRGLKIVALELDSQDADVLIITQTNVLGITMTDYHNLEELSVYQLMNLYDQINDLKA